MILTCLFCLHISACLSSPVTSTDWLDLRVSVGMAVLPDMLLDTDSDNGKNKNYSLQPDSGSLNLMCEDWLIPWDNQLCNLQHIFLESSFSRKERRCEDKMETGLSKALMQ